MPPADRLDLLVNNAVSARPQPAARARRLSRWTSCERVYAVNVLAPLALTQVALPLMRRRAARSLNVTSDAAVEPYAGLGRVRLVEGGPGAADRRSSAPSSRSCASTPSTRATCARGCTSRRFPARTSPTGRRRSESVPGLLALIRSDLPSGRYQARALADGGGRALSALAFELPRAPGGDRAAGGARRWRATRVRLLVADALRRLARSTRRFRELPAACSRPATCWSSTSRRRCRRRSPRVRGRRLTGSRARRHPRSGARWTRWRVVELRSRRRRPTGAAGRAGEMVRAPRRARRLELVAPLRRRAPGCCWRGSTGSASRCEELLGRLTASRFATGTWRRRGRSRPYQNVYATTPGQRRDAERRTAVHHRADRARWSRPRSGRGADRPARRGVLAGAPRAAVPGGVPGAGRHRRDRQRHAPAAGGRVIAVGTTVVRALETVGRARRGREPRSRAGPSLVVDPGPRRACRRRPHHRLARAGGLTSADAGGDRRPSRLLRALLRARRCAAGYLWHEFGDSHLILR